MKNFPFEHEGKTYWYSRSVAVVVFATAYNAEGKMCVLANKRGPGCPDYVGYWNCPCGYLDFDETGEQAAARECFEETGIKMDPARVVFKSVNTSPDSNRQNVTIRFAYRFNEPVEELMKQANRDNMEANEVDSIKFVPIDELENYEWAFGHLKLIRENTCEAYVEY